jgi:hypothetical protein
LYRRLLMTKWESDREEDANMRIPVLGGRIVRSDGRKFWSASLLLLPASVRCWGGASASGWWSGPISRKCGAAIWMLLAPATGSPPVAARDSLPWKSNNHRHTYAKICVIGKTNVLPSILSQGTWLSDQYLCCDTISINSEVRIGRCRLQSYQVLLTVKAPVLNTIRSADPSAG